MQGPPAIQGGMTSEPTTIDYEALTQDAMRGVVRTVLTRIAETGLPGDHHFYISFDTEQPGVTLSKRLREKYPREMTIVLQHRFWGLLVQDDRFEVKLTFDGIPERLVVPFEAIKVFFDPSVRYGLQFEDPDTGNDPGSLVGGNNGSEGETRVTATRSSGTGPKKPRVRKPPRPEVERQPARPAVPLKPVTEAAKNDTARPDGKKSDGHKTDSEPAEADKQPAGSAQIVSLDQFRKK